ncbi:hypothetical protein PSTG_00885 [Puccinia striiformis f. sp. tritici PST-78]|uniref:Uncharacterized protein n=1 Tax=Puccinia striiformis f. sp. tritici PST-78 TaxID=1165861 RepID=A0A0L0W301_9BASI|nr:hypothetical protein PSTG_00885 [Puccinia striiformis f. sp. tritici PST-78]
MARTPWVSASPRPSPTSRPPSRQSSRIVTPVKSHPNYVRTNNNTRRSLVNSSRTQKTAKKRKIQVVADTDDSDHSSDNSEEIPEGYSAAQSEANLDVEILDLAQDSDEENQKANKSKKPPTRGVAATGFDKVELYYEPPHRAEGVVDGPKLFFKCKWCSKPYKKGKDTQHNLYLHRDGSLTQAACPGRYAAIKAGANLPVTLKEEAAAKTKKQSESGIMKKFIQVANFNNRTLNQLLVMWLIQSSLPWLRLTDRLLAISFGYARRGITLNSRPWAAAEAHRLYVNLKDKVLSNLQALKSKITLIHDVWTTKGNRQAFLGIIATYISDNWVFKVCHLALKYIAWTHKGKYLAVPMASIIMKSSIASKITQTTDSGSNNRTMTVEVDRLIAEKLGVDLNLASNHVRCFCHKIALILTAGLKAIDISTEGLTPEKQETLGFIPKLNAIVEEPEDQDVLAINSDSEEEDILEDGPDDSEGESDNEEPGRSQENRSNQNRTQEGQSRVSMVLKRVDFVIQRITSSAARRSEFAVWAKKLEHVGQSLIAGYGIRWNIKWESRNRAYEASEVINKLIHNETIRHKREGGKHHFQEYEISTSDWEIVKSLNDILGEFYFTTKKMEGDHSSASLMISEYQCLKNFLEKQIAATSEPELKVMMVKMIEKTNIYLKEALSCDAIILATILNPAYRLSIFEVLFTAHHTYAKALLQRHFNERKLEIEARTGTRASSPLAECLKNFLEKQIAATSEPELKVMMVKMIEKTNIYLKEALSCDAIILATILNPAYRLSIFEVLFTAHHTYAKALLQRHFNERKLEIEARTGTRASSPLAEVASKPTTHRRAGELFNFYPDSIVSPPEDELASYLGWKHKLGTDKAEECLKQRSNRFAPESEAERKAQRF